MVPTLVTRTAQEQILALDEDERDAVDAAIGKLGEESGEPIDLPGVPEGVTYRAVKTSGNAPVVIYRAVPEDEGGGWLVLSLMSRDEYRDVQRVRQWFARLTETRAIGRSFGHSHDRHTDEALRDAVLKERYRQLVERRRRERTEAGEEEAYRGG
jgi:hypothetical protein